MSTCPASPPSLSLATPTDVASLSHLLGRLSIAHLHPPNANQASGMPYPSQARKRAFTEDDAEDADDTFSTLPPNIPSTPPRRLAPSLWPRLESHAEAVVPNAPKRRSVGTKPVGPPSSPSQHLAKRARLSTGKAPMRARRAGRLHSGGKSHVRPEHRPTSAILSPTIPRPSAFEHSGKSSSFMASMMEAVMKPHAQRHVKRLPTGPGYIVRRALD